MRGSTTVPPKAAYGFRRHAQEVVRRFRRRICPLRATGVIIQERCSKTATCFWIRKLVNHKERMTWIKTRKYNLRLNAIQTWAKGPFLSSNVRQYQPNILVGKQTKKNLDKGFKDFLWDAFFSPHLAAEEKRKDFLFRTDLILFPFRWKVSETFTPSLVGEKWLPG